MKSMLILSVFILFASCVVCEDKADKAEDGDLEKCGKSLEKLYNKVCSEKDVGGKKLFAVRKICFMYPPKVLKHKEIVDVMEECNTEKQVCDTEKMSEVSYHSCGIFLYYFLRQCGRKKFEKASEKYEEKAKEQKLEDKTLPEMFANSQKEVASACNETLVSTIEKKFTNFL